MSERRIWKIAVQLLLTIAEFKSHELVICDIKASNVLLVDDSHVVLCDFDAAIKTGSLVHESSRLTPYYAR